MCGIVGMVADAPIGREALLAARDLLSHRGPDAAGVWMSADGTVGLGHRRLSIIDLSDAGAQPMAHSERGLQIVFNGEIYNFKELRRELERAGCRLLGDSDTEVLLHAYAEWGDDCVTRLRGMFAFAIWDEKARRLFAARDRLGIKPFYYYFDGRRFAFASELKALEQWPRLSLPVDESALYDFLTYLYVPEPKSPYATVFKLPPAHTLEFVGGRVSTHEYWRVDFGQTIRPSGDLVEALREQLSDAVQGHLIADVPVGSLLSGGIDSSVVTSLAAKKSTGPLHTFSIGFDDEKHSETHYAQMVARSVGSTHHEHIVALNAARESAKLLGTLFDEPFGDSSAMPTLAVSKLARQHVKVALSGDGGDEVFGGYLWYAQHLRRRRFTHVPAILRQHLPALLERSGVRNLRGVPKLINGLRPDLERHAVTLGGFSHEHKKLVLTPQALKRFSGYDDYWHFRQHWRTELDLMSRLQYLDLKTYLPGDILTKVDRTSMSVGLELRPPLLDHKLVEFVASLPVEVRNPAGSLKHLFKQAARGLVPDAVIERAKKGFSVPHSHKSSATGSEAGGPRLTADQTWLLERLKEWSSSSSLHRVPDTGPLLA